MKAPEQKFTAVVGEYLVNSHVVGAEPPLGTPPELHEGGGGFVVVGFDVGDTGAVVDGDMQIGVTDTSFRSFGLGVAASVDPLAASLGGICPALLMSRCTNSPAELRS